MKIDLSDDATAKKALAAVVVVVCVVIAFVLSKVVGDDSAQPSPQETPSATAPAEPTSETVPETTAPTGEDEAEAPAEAVEVAEQSVLAISEFSWKDKGHLAFLKKLQPYATEGLVHAYEETFGGDEIFDYQWETEVVETKTERRAEIVSVIPTTIGSDDEWKFEVAYTTETRQDGGVWGDQQSMQQSVTVTRTPEGWKASALDEVNDQGI